MKNFEEIVEQDVPVIESKLWKYMFEYYKNLGIQAWDKRVPYKISSNVYMGSYYANFICNFIEDIIEQSCYVKDEPIYIIELGAGHGKLSYHLLNELHKLLERKNLMHIKLCYVIHDGASANIEEMEKHPYFSCLVKKCVLDFLHCDLTDFTEFKLIHSDIVLSNESVNNPIIGIANYLFDSLPNDFYKIENGSLKRGYMTLSIDSDKSVSEKIKDIKDLKQKITYRTVNKKNIYPEKIFNDILYLYCQSKDNLVISYPYHSLKIINYLNDITDARLMMLVSDKGHITESAYKKKMHDIGIVYHDQCFSVMVNFDTIAKYINYKNSDIKFLNKDSYFITSMILGGYKIDSLLRIKLIADNNLITSPCDRSSLLFGLTQYGRSDNIQYILSVFKESHYDIEMVDLYVLNSAVLLIKKNNKKFIKLFRPIFESCLNKLYILPGNKYIYLQVALILKELGEYERALEYLNKVPDDKKDYVYFNCLRACYLELDELSKLKKIRTLWASILLTHWYKIIKIKVVAYFKLLSYVLRFPVIVAIIVLFFVYK